MFNINLLPWRRLQQEKKQDKYLNFLVFATLFFIALGFFASYYFHYLIENKIQENVSMKHYLEAMLKLEHDTNKLNQKITTLQAILDKQKKTLTVLEGLAVAAPEKLYLIKASYSENEIVLAGYAESPKPISDFMTTLIDLDLINQPRLNVFDIKKDNYFEIYTQYNVKE